MAYVGRRPLIGNYIVLDAITASATTTFNLTQSGSAYSPQLAQNCIVSVNGVIQAPNTSYTISGSTIVFSTALATTDTINFITVLGDVLNVGTPSAGTVNAASFASGFNGVVTWQNVQTTNFTAVAGRGYPVNTTSAGITMTLPASATTGATIQVVDYAGTAATNPIVINPNGLKLNGSTSSLQMQNNREGLQLTYVDSTQGWVAALEANSTTDLQPVTYSVDFLVVAGGGGGPSSGNRGSGGAGGYRSSNATYGSSGGGGSAESSLTFKGGNVYTITVGAGGAAGVGSDVNGVVGNNSSISGTGITTITSNGGGYGGAGTVGNGGSGGSGGGANYQGVGGSGTANQGYAGGNGSTDGSLGIFGGGGGGGASAVGTNGSGSSGGNGGNGLASSITGSSVTRGGGGAGGTYSAVGTGAGTAGSGGGGSVGNAGTANTGGGGGGCPNISTGGGAGGSGVVILRMKTVNYSGTTSGSPTVTTSGSDTILTFNASGSYTG